MLESSEQILLYVSPLDRVTPLVLDSSYYKKRHYTILKNSSFRGCGIFNPSCIRAGDLRDHFHSIIYSYQKCFAEAFLHLINFANRSSIFCKRRNHMTQFSNVTINAPLQELLFLFHQEATVSTLKERIFTNRLTFSAMSEGCALALKDAHRGMRRRDFSPRTLESCHSFQEPAR